MLAMWPKRVVAESERVQWSYVPRESVGPLRFGMNAPEAIEVIGALGFASGRVELSGKVGPLKRDRVRFRRADAPQWETDVTVYFVEPLGATCIVVDALTGPQVTLDAMRLVGRKPSELSDELTAYLDGRGLDIEITTEGDVGSEPLGILPRAQRAGDVLLTRVVFGRHDGCANTLFDCVPAEEWRIR